jgi:PAS domain S-box-containing protein
VTVAEPLIQSTLIGEALDNGPALVFVADENMRYVAVNARACAEVGYDRAELLAMQVTDLCRYVGAPDEYDEMLAEGERAGEAEVTRKDGTTFVLRYVASQTRVAGMPFYVSVGRVVA